MKKQTLQPCVRAGNYKADPLKGNFGMKSHFKFTSLGLLVTLSGSCSQPPELKSAHKDSGNANGTKVGNLDPEVGDPILPTPTPTPVGNVVIKDPVPPIKTPEPVPEPEVSKEGDGDFPIGPQYTKDPQMNIRDNIAKGKVQQFSMKSSDSKIYKGTETDQGLTKPQAFTRDAWIYTPAGYKDNTEVPFMIVQDGRDYKYVDIIDNLIADKKIPAIAVIFINPGPGDGMGSQRGLEYDTVSTAYAEFVETEVLPKITTDFKVKFTADPEGRATMGGSSGAAAALTMAWLRNDLYHRILSYSGTFVAQHPDKTYPAGAWEFHSDMNLIMNSAKKNLRIYMEVGSRDNNFGGNRDWTEANKRTAKALAAKGYHYRYNYADDAGHVDRRVVNQTLPEALIWLWRGYKAK